VKAWKLADGQQTEVLLRTRQWRPLAVVSFDSSAVTIQFHPDVSVVASELVVRHIREHAFGEVGGRHAVSKPENMALTIWMAKGQSVDREPRMPVADGNLHSLLHLLESARFDLPHTLTRDAKLGGQLLQRERLISEVAPLEDAPLTIA
jgi:hypothetical protein